MNMTIRRAGKCICLLLVGAAIVAVSTPYLGAQAPAAPASPLEKAKAAAQQTEAERAAAEKAVTEKATAAKVAADANAAAQAAAAKASQEAAAAEKAAQDAAAKAAEAQKAAAERKAAAQQATEAAAAAKAAADAAQAAQTAAAKDLAQKAAAAQTARQKVAAEEAYHARRAVEKSKTDLAAAEKALAGKQTAAQQASQQYAAAQAAAEKATAEQAAALQTLNSATDADKPALQKSLDEKTAAAAAAAQKAAEAKAAAERTTAEVQAAQEAVRQQAAAIPAVEDRAAAAEAAALGGLKPLAAGQWDYAKARHLLARAGFGGTPEEVQQLYERGLHGAVDYLVNYHQQASPPILFDVRPQERPLTYEAHLDVPERTQLFNERTNRERSQLGPLRQWWLRRMAETPRPLEEKLVLFWHDHFATGFEDKLYNAHILYKQNEFFREYADQFEGLLRGIIHDPAMIVYLDNQQNVKGGTNENLGREVLELFSLGRDQGYTENDLRELARALTGYSYVPHLNAFRFNGSRHDEGPKTILGRTGNFSGDEAIDIILQHPSTARYLAKKLFQYFVHWEPADESIEQLASSLRAGNYDLAPALKNLFLSEEFYSERAVAQQIKSPIALMIGTIRTLGVKQVNYASVDWQLQAMGQTLFQPPNVAGWEEGRFWLTANRILLRYNGAADLVEQPSVDLVAAVEGKASNPAEAVDYLARACLATDLTAAQRQALIEFVGPLPPAAEWSQQREPLNAKLRALAVLLVSTPEYQVH